MFKYVGNTDWEQKLKDQETVKKGVDFKTILV